MGKQQPPHNAIGDTLSMDGTLSERRRAAGGRSADNDHAARSNEQTVSKHTRSRDIAWPHSRAQRGNHRMPCASPTPGAVHHRGQRAVNPAASLSLVTADDNDAGDRRVCGDPDVLIGSADRLPEETRFGPGRRSHRSNRDCRGHSGGRSPPDNGNGHSGRVGRCPSSAKSFQEEHRRDWTRARNSAILRRGPCLTRAVGCGAG